MDMTQHGRTSRAIAPPLARYSEGSPIKGGNETGGYYIAGTGRLKKTVIQV